MDYLTSDELINKLYIVTIGITKLKDKYNVEFLLNNSKYIILNENGYFELKENNTTGIIYSDRSKLYISEICKTYTHSLLLNSKININDNICEYYVNSKNIIDEGFYYDCILIVKNNISQIYNVNFNMYFKEIHSTMIPKEICDTYAYFNTHSEIVNNINNDVIDKNIDSIGKVKSYIEKKSIHNIPWTYYINDKIPTRFHEHIKNGILSWNIYFRHIGINDPIKYGGITKKIYPNSYEWIICSLDIDNYNTRFCGTSNSLTDYRTGENIAGTIYLCLSKIVGVPCKYVLLSNDNINIEEHVYKYVSYIVCHEVGHELGLRHNFSGNHYGDSNGTIMDYIDVFLDSSTLKLLNIDELNRIYDINALKYAYTDDIIFFPNSLSVTTDDNFNEKINPYIDMNSSFKNGLEYIKYCLETYKKYRENIMKIPDKYIYNILFLYIYIRKYNELINMCVKYIGGRKYSKDRTKYEHIEKNISINAIKLLNEIINNIHYKNEEFMRICYNIDGLNKNNVIFIDTDDYYSMGHGELFCYYKSHIDLIINSVFELYSKLINNSSSINYMEVMDIFLYSENGLFNIILNNPDKIWIFEIFMKKLIEKDDSNNMLIYYNLKKIFPHLIKSEKTDNKIKILLSKYK